MFSLATEGPIARLTIKREGKRNAIPVEGWEGLARAVAAIDADKAKVVLLASGIDGVFSAGADVAELATLRDDPPARVRFREAMRGGIEALAACPLPTVALVEGGCFGAAVALALACDVRVAGEGARFAVTPARLGIAYPCEDVARLARAVGRGQAARLLHSATTIDVGEALRIGLVELDGGRAAAEALVADIAANARSSLVALKAMLGLAEAGRFGGEADKRFDEAFASEDFARGLDAFRRRETPEFP